MLTQTWKSVRSSFPLSGWTIAVAAVVALVHGSSHLGETVDLATAIGIADFLSIAIGCWLAVRLYGWLVRAYAAWTATLEARTVSILERLPVEFDETDDAENGAGRVPVAALLVAQSSYLTLLSCGAFTSSVLSGILMAQIDGQGYGLNVAAAIASFAVIAVSVMAQCLYFWRLHRKVASIEQQVAVIDILPRETVLVAQRAEALDNGITGAERLGRRFVGMRPLSAERATI